MMEYYSPYVEDAGSDETGFGRWSWIKLEGNNILKTMIISAYMPCKTRKQSMLSNYAQQERYWRMKGVDTCAKKKYREDLIEFILKSKMKGERVILMLDKNKNMMISTIVKPK